MERRYNFNQEFDVMFVTNEEHDAIEAAKDFGQETVVVTLDKEGKKQRVFTAPYKSDLTVRNELISSFNLFVKFL